MPKENAELGYRMAIDMTLGDSGLVITSSFVIRHSSFI